MILDSDVFLRAAFGGWVGIVLRCLGKLESCLRVRGEEKKRK